MKKALEVQNTKVPCSKGCGKRLDYHYVKTHELKCHPASQSEPRPSNISSRASAANEKTETCGQCNEVLQNQQALVDHYAQKHPSPQLAAQIPASLPSQIINQPYASVTNQVIHQGARPRTTNIPNVNPSVSAATITSMEPPLVRPRPNTIIEDGKCPKCKTTFDFVFCYPHVVSCGMSLCHTCVIKNERCIQCNHWHSISWPNTLAQFLYNNI